MQESRSSHLHHLIQTKINPDDTRQPTSFDIFRVPTNMDTFPYNKWFRGNFHSSNPTIIKRLAGWTPVNRYYSTNADVSSYPSNCFIIPPHTYKPLVCKKRYGALNNCNCSQCTCSKNRQSGDSCCEWQEQITLPP